MKFLLSAGLFALSASIANAGPVPLKMFMTMNEFSNFSRKIPMQKRFTHTQTQLKTKGFRPEKPIETNEWHTLKLPEKVEYVDEAHETFKTPPGFQEKLEKSLRSKGTEQSSKFDDALKKK